MVDLTNSHFWVCLAIAWILLNVQARKDKKTKTIAIINLGFIAWVINPWIACGVAVAIALLVKLLSIIHEPKSQQAALFSLLLLTVMSVFFVEVQSIARALTISEVRRMVIGLGFSYLLLRFIELARYLWENTEEKLNWWAAVAYLLPFHMLAAGPIQRYGEFRTAITESQLGQEDTVVALERISTGLFKKYVLAETLHRVCLTEFQHPDSAYLFLEFQLSYIWLYLDFSAYADVAVGAGLLLGYKTPENFNNPLLAPNLIELWERWHISLSRFIKFNIFIPLQFWLSRKSGGQYPLVTGSIVFLVSFLLCGLWHQVSITFMLWGLMHGIGLATCKAYQTWAYRKFGKKRLLKSKILRVISTILTFEFVALSWAVVSAPEVTLSIVAKLLL